MGKHVPVHACIANCSSKIHDRQPKNAGKNRARAVPAPKNGAECPRLDRLIFFLKISLLLKNKYLISEEKFCFEKIYDREIFQKIVVCLKYFYKI